MFNKWYHECFRSFWFHGSKWKDSMEHVCYQERRAVTSSKLKILQMWSCYRSWIAVILAGFHQFFCVCKWEKSFQATVHKDRHCKDAFKSCITKETCSMQHIVVCSHNDCSLHAHSICIEFDKFIFSLLHLKGLSCFRLHIMRKQLVCGFLIQNLIINAQWKNGMEELCPKEEIRQCQDWTHQHIQFLIPIQFNYC